MLDITVKTLDGQNRTYSVPENITVKQFKEKVATSINIPADTQRLIFQGKVLQDEKLMKDYDVHGKVVHVVIRPPPSTTRPSSNTNNNPQPNTTTPGRDVNSIVVGSFTLPSDILDANMVQGIAQDAIRSMGDLGRNARVTTRTSADGSALDVHIHLGPIQSGQTVSEAQMRLNTARTMIRLANDSLERLENSTPGSGSRTGTPRSSSPAPSRESGDRTSTPRSSSPLASTEAASETPTRLSPMDTSEEEPTSSQQPSETAESSPDVGSTQTETGASSPPASQNEATATSSQSGESTPPGSGSQDQNSQQPRGPVRPNITAMADVMVEFNELTRRLQPHMQRFTDIIRADAEMSGQEQRENQRVCNHISEVMHAFSHGYHALSDLMVDLSQARPRQLYVTLAIAHPHTTVIQQAIPVQARIEIGGSPRLIRRQFAGDHPTNLAADADPFVAVPIPRPGVNTSTTSTGTSTIPSPSTTETGTQPNRPSTTETGTQPSGGAGAQGEGEDLDRISQEMRAGLENVLGQNLQQGDGSPDNPYVFVEMGPDRMTVNSISAQVVSSTDDDVDDPEPGTESSTTPNPSVSTSGSVPPTSTTTAGQPIHGLHGMPPGVLPPNLIQGIMQQILQQTGQVGQPQRMQINIGQGPPPMPRPGMPMGFSLGPHIRPGAVRNESGTQTAGSNGVPANSGTQTPATPTSTFGTQTSRTTPSSTSGTQTPGVSAAFVVPGAVPGGAPVGLPGPFQGNLPGGLGLNPADPYLPCSSRHFLTRHATSILNNANGNQQQNNDTVLADMVGNLMSGLLGGATGTGSTTSTASSATSSTAGAGTGTRTTGGPAPTRPATSTTGPGFTIGPQPQRAGGPMFRGPFTLGSLFPGRMPSLTGMRFQVRTPRAAGQTQPPTPASTQPSSNTSSTAPQTGTTNTSTLSPGEPQFVQMLRTMLQQSSQRPRPEPTQATSTTPTPAAGTTTDQNQNVQTGTPQAPITDEAFTQLVSGITNYMSQAAVGQAPAQTIGDFIRNLHENYSMPQGEGFINDVLSCILANLQITDMLQLFYGNPTPLNQVQGPLRNFLNTRVLENEPPTEQNIRSGVIQLLESMETELQALVTAAAPRPHIDFLATTRRFLSQQFFNVIFLIMNSRDGDTNFGRDLYACIRRLLAEMFVLCSRCLGGMPQVERFVNQRLITLITGVNPVIQEWMSGITRRQISAFIPTITVTEGEVSVYLVNRRPGQPTGTPSAQKPAAVPKKKPAQSTSEAKPSTQKESGKRDPSPLRAPSPKRVSKKEEVVKSPVTPMETSPLMSSPGASEMEVEAPKNSVQTSRGAEASDLNQSKSTPPTENQPSPSGAQASNGDWQSVVPADWVPVITRDIETQKKQNKQSPYSDVYLQGVPPKRRRLMTQDRPSNISNASEVLPESVRRAVEAAAVEPISNMDNLLSEINNDSELQQSFENQVSSTLSDRVNNDSDYKEERFPGSNEYFHKTNDKKK